MAKKRNHLWVVEVWYKPTYNKFKPGKWAPTDGVGHTRERGEAEMLEMLAGDKRGSYRLQKYEAV